MLGISLRAAIANLLLSALAAAAPNVIVLVADDPAYMDSAGRPPTQAIERLRGESTVIADFRASPNGVASTAAMLTGRHEFAVGVSHRMAGRSLLAPGVPTLPELLGGAGYATGVFGRWRLGDGFPCRPEDRGCDEVFVHGSGGLGGVGDHWGNGGADPMMRRGSGWSATEGMATDVVFDEAIRWMKGRSGEEHPFFLWLAPDTGAEPGDRPEQGSRERLADFDANLERLVSAVESLGIADDTVLVVCADRAASVPGGSGATSCLIRWPGEIPAGVVVAEPAAPFDLMPSVAGMCGIALPEGWTGDGSDLSSALMGEVGFPSGRTFFTHAGGWSGDETASRNRMKNFSVSQGRWRLTGLELFDVESDPDRTTNLFGKHPEVATRLLAAYGRWWDSVVPIVREPVRLVIGDDRQAVAVLSCHDWWPSREEGTTSRMFGAQTEIRDYLDRARMAGTRNELPGVSGHWKVTVARDGNYRVRTALLPRGAPAGDLERLAILRPGTAHVRAGREEVSLELLAGAREVSVSLDLDAGATELEAWFEGQLPVERKLGAFFVEVERLGERRRSKAEFRIEKAPSK